MEQQLADPEALVAFWHLLRELNADAARIMTQADRTETSRCAGGFAGIWSFLFYHSDRYMYAACGAKNRDLYMGLVKSTWQRHVYEMCIRDGQSPSDAERRVVETTSLHEGRIRQYHEAMLSGLNWGDVTLMAVEDAMRDVHLPFLKGGARTRPSRRATRRHPPMSSSRYSRTLAPSKSCTCRLTCPRVSRPG